jgi:hypothetical protein
MGNLRGSFDQWKAFDPWFERGWEKSLHRIVMRFLVSEGPVL